MTDRPVQYQHQYSAYLLNLVPTSLAIKLLKGKLSIWEKLFDWVHFNTISGSTLIHRERVGYRVVHQGKSAEKLVNFNTFVSQIGSLPRFNLEMNKLPPSGIDFVFIISGNFSLLDGLISRYFTFRVAKFLASIGCSNHFFYTNRHRNIHII